MARRDFENEMAAMAGRLRKKNDDRFTKKAEAVEEEEDEEMSPALAAALAKVYLEPLLADVSLLPYRLDTPRYARLYCVFAHFSLPTCHPHPRLVSEK
jgi:hypothetical protein